MAFLHRQKWHISSSVKHALTRSHTALFVVGPTRLWCLDGHFIGICTNPMLALCSQLESVGGERLQVLQEVGGGRLKAHFLLQGHGKKSKETETKDGVLSVQKEQPERICQEWMRGWVCLSFSHTIISTTGLLKMINKRKHRSWQEE